MCLSTVILYFNMHFPSRIGPHTHILMDCGFEYCDSNLISIGPLSMAPKPQLLYVLCSDPKLSSPVCYFAQMHLLSDF